MTNHVHLLMSPRQGGGVARLMQSLGRRYAQYLNRTYKHSGSVWEGRFKASVIDAEEYLLACYRYIELDPITAGMVNDPADYRWTSYRRHGLGEANPLITDHPLYRALAGDEVARRPAYRALVRAHLDEAVVADIRKALTSPRSPPKSTVRSTPILEVSDSDSITFQDWYAAPLQTDSTLDLQVIADAMAGSDPGSTDPLLNARVQQFDLGALVGSFDQAQAQDSMLERWNLMDKLLDAHLASSDTEALGGDLAYYYGTNGALTGIGLTAAQDVLSFSGFGSQTQALRPIEGLQEGLVRLA